MPIPAYTLYHYWRSSSSWRVRYAFAAKNIEYKPVAVNLLNGESESAEHLARNPAGFVPVLEFQHSGKLERLTESLAIIDYLDRAHSSGPKLYPEDPIARAKAWALAEVINAGTQPIQNIPVFTLHSSDAAEQKKWNQHWIRNGLEIYEELAKPVAGAYSYGNQLTVADCCLLPQIYNAERFEVPFRDLPTVTRIYESCIVTPAYRASHPDRFKPAVIPSV
ncbi:MAG: maleylacetoacetate isomerase [Bdellovibrionales bacterium]|nr:maleylacetoacetate isomerase [Bdellovibrionales bacterium]